MFRVVFIIVRLFNTFDIIDICVLCDWHGSIKEIYIIHTHWPTIEWYKIGTNRPILSCSTAVEQVPLSRSGQTWSAKRQFAGLIPLKPTCYNFEQGDVSLLGPTPRNLVVVKQLI